MMTQTGKVAAAWLLAATQTDIYNILLLDPTQRNAQQKAKVNGLDELDQYFRQNRAALIGAAAVMIAAKPSFVQLLQASDYTGSSCPGGGQLVALGEQGV